jgi:hypothetical protein
MSDDLRAETPKTPGAMLDQLHEWFGIGDYDDIASSRPFHRERMVEIAKLKALLKSRRASLTEVWIAAQYARDNGKTPRATWQVFALIPEAMRERFRKAAAGRDDAGWAEAIEEALDAGEQDWAERLMRAGDKAKAVEEWRNRG